MNREFGSVPEQFRPFLIRKKKNPDFAKVNALVLDAHYFLSELLASELINSIISEVIKMTEIKETLAKFHNVEATLELVKTTNNCMTELEETIIRYGREDVEDATATANARTIVRKNLNRINIDAVRPTEENINAVYDYINEDPAVLFQKIETLQRIIRGYAQ